MACLKNPRALAAWETSKSANVSVRQWVLRTMEYAEAPPLRQGGTPIYHRKGDSYPAVLDINI